MYDERITELLALAESEGITLPMTPQAICWLEDAGHVVDLDTGVVHFNEADRLYQWEWTPAGDAFGHLVEAGLIDL